MERDGLLHIICEGTRDACYIWREEVKMVLRDEGVLLFCLLLPLVYPLLYSWVYNNEVVREVPTAVVDLSNTALSRQFVRQCDASPDVAIVAHAGSLAEARQMVERQQVRGFYYIPADFGVQLGRMQQATVSVYVDMSVMLYYKAIYQAATAVSQSMNGELQVALSGKYTAREEEIATAPLTFDEVALFNPSGGYGSFIIPGVLMLIIQQTLLLGIGLSAGTAREKNRYQDLVPIQKHYHGTFRIVLGKGLCYLMIYAVMGAYLTMVVPRIFGFVALAGWRALLGIMTPFLLACISFGMVVSCVVRYRENVFLLIVFTSVPLLFLSGAVSWPLSNIPGFWQGVSWLFPSTFGVRAFVRLSTMGAQLSDVVAEYRALWVQAACYFLLACVVYRYQIIQSKKHAVEKLMELRRRRAELRNKLANE